MRDVKAFGKVAVLMGGTSTEREISLSSGQGVLQALLDAGVDAHKLDVGQDSIDELKAGQFDRAFVILHGRDGEDGKIQAVLETLGIPYTGSGIAASALAMDKYRTKLIAQGAGFKTPRFLFWQKGMTLSALDDFHFPLAVKPVHEGSSFGVSRVNAIEELEAAIEKASSYHDDVLIEEWIIGGEYTVPIIAGRALPSIKISTPNREFYDLTAKYTVCGTVYECPNDLTADEEAFLGRLSLEIFELLGCRHWGRVDFMRDKQGEFYLIELNTVPGMTPTSLPIKSAKTVGMTYQDLVLDILACTLTQ